MVPFAEKKVEGWPADFRNVGNPSLRGFQTSNGSRGTLTSHCTAPCRVLRSILEPNLLPGPRIFAGFSHDTVLSIRPDRGGTCVYLTSRLQRWALFVGVFHLSRLCRIQYSKQQI